MHVGNILSFCIYYWFSCGKKMRRTSDSHARSCSYWTARCGLGQRVRRVWHAKFTRRSMPLWHWPSTSNVQQARPVAGGVPNKLTCQFRTLNSFRPFLPIARLTTVAFLVLNVLFMPGLRSTVGQKAVYFKRAVDRKHIRRRHCHAWFRKPWLHICDRAVNCDRVCGNSLTQACKVVWMIILW